MSEWKTISISCNKLTVNLLDAITPVLEDYDSFQCHVDRTHDEAPLPWDAWVRIEVSKDGRNMLVIEGGAGASGFGSCVVKVPLISSGCYFLVLESMKGKPFPPEVEAIAAGEVCRDCNKPISEQTRDLKAYQAVRLCADCAERVK